MNKIRNIDSSLTNQNEISLFYTRLFVKRTWMTVKNRMLNATIEYILSSEKFNVPLFE